MHRNKSKQSLINKIIKKKKLLKEYQEKYKI